jgi:hypothetical protein
VLAQPIVAELRLDPAIARAVDAGLLTTARHLRVDLSLGAAAAAAEPGRRNHGSRARLNARLLHRNANRKDTP